MNILQTYYDDRIHEHGLDISGRYLNSVTNWLSIAYSCLTLKKNNQKSPLFFMVILILCIYFRIYSNCHMMNIIVLIVIS